MYQHDSALKLTSQQRVFAEREHAVPGVYADQARGSIFMYREEPLAGLRWLVDPSGRVLDSDRFSRR
jgi:hypothetical protein